MSARLDKAIAELTNIIYATPKKRADAAKFPYEAEETLLNELRVEIHGAVQELVGAIEDNMVDTLADRLAPAPKCEVDNCSANATVEMWFGVYGGGLVFKKKV